MLSNTYLLALGLVLGLTAWRLWQWKTQRNLEDEFGKEQGCQPIQTIFRGQLPLGVDLVKRLVGANAGKHLLSYLQPYVDELGPTFELRILGNVGLVTIDPENIKAVLSKSKFHEGELDFVYGARREALLPLFGEGLFTQDGTAWKRSRELLRKQFARIQYHNLEIFRDHVELLVDRITSSKSDIIDLQPLFFNFTLDTTTKLLFGESAGSLQEESSDEFGMNPNKAAWYSGIRVQLSYLYWVCSPPQYRRACNKVRDYADRWVQKALDNSDDEKDGSDDYTFIRSLYEEMQDRKLVREQLVNVLLAGRDTTASMLSWAFRLVLRHESAFKRLKAEIADTLNGDTEITKPKLQRLPYLKCVLTETLRLFPLVPVNFRESNHATVLPRGGGSDGSAPVLVRAKRGIGYSPYFMHRRKDLYGEDAFDFRPERWEDGTLAERIGWAYLPFNGGPRICLGQEFALLEASYAIIRIVQALPDLSLAPDESIEPPGEERQSITLTLAPSDGCRVQLR